jgi:integral membrane protein (TIGR00529 family)
VLGICSIVTAALFLMPPKAFGLSLLGTLTTYDTWRLLLIVVCILILSACMRASGALQDLVGSVSHMVSDNRVTIALLPALIGFLPVPGGALFSAPMIQEPSAEADVSMEQRAFLNYWFRHVWEYSYPLYPGLLLEATILHVDIVKIIAFQFPLSIAAILAGVIFGLSRVRRIRRKIEGGKEFRTQLVRFMSGFWPVLLIVLGIFVIPWAKILPGINFDALMVTLPGVTILFGVTRLGWKGFMMIVTKDFDLNLPLIVLSVLIFKDIISHSGAAEDLSVTFQRWGVPELVLFAVLPMLMGYLTGITHSYVSVAFPLLIPFFGPPGSLDLAKVQLAYTAGFIGVILSPVHLCLILSCAYYRADLNKVYKLLYLPVLLVALASLALYYFR